MNINSKITPAVSLYDKLVQSGHLWYASQLLKGKVEGVLDFVEAQKRITALLVQWGIQATPEEIEQLVRSVGDSPKTTGIHGKRKT